MYDNSKIFERSISNVCCLFAPIFNLLLLLLLLLWFGGSQRRGSGHGPNVDGGWGRGGGYLNSNLSIVSSNNRGRGPLSDSHRSHQIQSCNNADSGFGESDENRSQQCFECEKDRQSNGRILLAPVALLPGGTLLLLLLLLLLPMMLLRHAPHAPFQSRVATATVSPTRPKGRPRVEVTPRSSEPVSRI